MAVVDQGPILEAISFLQEQAANLNGVVQRYGQSSADMQGAGSWRGPAVVTNLMTVEEINHVTTNINNRFTQAQEILRGNVHSFGDVDTQNVSDLQSVTSGFGSGFFQNV
ncbi:MULTISPECIES: hypothetical protein [Mycolicibacterium]|jgi:hypothetical protein|uniref:hypothetical protein n=1 Tax=Mycolicibacterium TaxID=1866885 RepID=UPI001E599DD3|nr:hypothetical protein [Mycolicibacterium mageritense]MCC9184355.1 hypothetical protein [Mycolicibacterium mageritense]